MNPIKYHLQISSKIGQFTYQWDDEEWNWETKNQINKHRYMIIILIMDWNVQERHQWHWQLVRNEVWRYPEPLNDIFYIHPKKISSGVDNWYLDEFFEKFICGRWNIYLEQTIYHLYRPICCWLSSLAVEYHLLWTIISYVVWYSSPTDDIQLKQMILIWRGRYSSRADNIQLKQMILIWRGRYSSRTDDIHPMKTILIQERRISSMMVDAWNYNQPLEMIFNHCGS
jgi:hypothetical protein